VPTQTAGATRLSLLEEGELRCSRSGLAARAGVELAQDRRDVMIHSAGREEQELGSVYNLVQDLTARLKHRG
jgi:hypothetical protein